MKELDIRYSKISDEKLLLKWMLDEENSKWFTFSTKKEIEGSVRNWIGFSKFKASLTGVLNNEIVSIATLFLMPYRKLAHEAMIYLIVDKNHRKKGIGSDMLKNLIHLAKNSFKLESLFIEVFDGSEMIPLLKKYKFEEFAYQEKYIKENNHYKDRILFDLWLK
ncbi:MAG: hypothetical protein KR126chlam6_01221 [Candidatus Anoxychlamydiales bacterium]|nr:hypothetical protein [Candidatus Anoxychlamydiales bacterium]